MQKKLPSESDSDFCAIFRRHTHLFPGSVLVPHENPDSVRDRNDYFHGFLPINALSICLFLTVLSICLSRIVCRNNRILWLKVCSVFCLGLRVEG